MALRVRARPGRGWTPSTSPQLPALASELLERVERDQEARRRLIKENTPEARKHVAQVDAENTARMKAVIAEHGLAHPDPRRRRGK